MRGDVTKDKNSSLRYSLYVFSRFLKPLLRRGVSVLVVYENLPRDRDKADLTSPSDPLKVGSLGAIAPKKQGPRRERHV